MSNPFPKLTLPVNYNQCSTDMRRLVRQEYVRVQEGLCAYCSQSLDGPAAQHIEKTPIKTSLFPIGFFNNPVHLHHDHGTGMTIGAVHARCNAYLWQYKGE